MSETYVLGMDAKMYLRAREATLPANYAAATGMVECDNVRDLTLTMETGESDVTTRGNSGWRGTAATLRECTVDFEMVWKPSDTTGFGVVKTAFLNASTLQVGVFTGADDVDESEGPFGEFSVTKFDRQEPLEEAILVSVTLKLVKFIEWVVIDIP